MIITVSSQKGGVGKTTTAISLAAKLALNGYPTLLVDLDQQGHAAIGLGLDPAPGVFNWLVAQHEFENCRRVTHIGHLDILPGDSHTKTVDLVYRANLGGHEKLVSQLNELDGEQHSPSLYRYVVIDTPAAGLLQEVAIAVADRLVIPVRCEHLGLDGVNATLGLAENLNPDVTRLIVPTQFDARLNEHKYSLGLLHDNVPAGCTVAAPIPARVAVAEAVSCGRTVWEYPVAGIQDVRTGYEWVLETLLGVQDDNAES